MKKFVKAILAGMCAAVIICLGLLAACGKTVELASISLDTSQARNSFMVDEQFSAEGLAVTAVYSDESTRLLERGEYQVSTPNMSVAGAREVVVSYTEGDVSVQATYNIVVNEPLRSLSADATGAKTKFSLGEAFSSAGLVVTYTVGTNSTVLEPSQYSLTPPDMTIIGTQSVTVAYDGLETSYQIEVDGEPMKFINTSDDGATLELYITDRVGGGQNTQDAAVSGKYVYTNGEEVLEFAFSYTYTAANWTSAFNTEGIYESVLNDMWSQDNGYLFAELGDEQKEFSAMRFKVSGNEWHTRVLGWTETAAITGVTLPEGRTYYGGTAFDGTGIQIAYTMTDGQTGTLTVTAEDIASGKVQFFNTADKSNMYEGGSGAALAEGTNSIRLMYDSAVYDFELVAAAAPKEEIEQLVLDYSLATREYLAGATVSTEGLVVKGVVGDTQIVLGEGDYELTVPSAQDIATPGVYEVVVTSGELEASYQILVIPDVNWDTNKLDFGNISDTGDRLELYITERQSASGEFDSATDSASSGWYVVKYADGSYKVMQFGYTYTANGWQSTFAQTEGAEQSLGNDGALVVTVDGVAYSAGSAYWHRVIIGWAE